MEATQLLVEFINLVRAARLAATPLTAEGVRRMSIPDFNEFYKVGNHFPSIPTFTSLPWPATRNDAHPCKLSCTTDSQLQRQCSMSTGAGAGGDAAAAGRWRTAFVHETLFLRMLHR